MQQKVRVESSGSLSPWHALSRAVARSKLRAPPAILPGPSQQGETKVRMRGGCSRQGVLSAPPEVDRNWRVGGG